MKREQRDADLEGHTEGDESRKNKINYSQPVPGSRHKQLLTQHGPSKGHMGQRVSQRFSISSIGGADKQRALLS